MARHIIGLLRQQNSRGNKGGNQPTSSNGGQSMPLQTMAIMFKALQTTQSCFDAEVAKELALTYTQCCQTHPQLLSLSNEAEIDAESNANFQKVYTEQMSVDELIDMLNLLTVVSSFKNIFKHLFKRSRLVSKTKDWHELQIYHAKAWEGGLLQFSALLP